MTGELALLANKDLSVCDPHRTYRNVSANFSCTVTVSNLPVVMTSWVRLLVKNA